MSQEPGASQGQRRYTNTQDDLIGRVWRKIRRIAEQSFRPQDNLFNDDPHLAETVRYRGIELRPNPFAEPEVVNNFLVIDGERGTGKSTIVRAVRNRAYIPPWTSPSQSSPEPATRQFGSPDAMISVDERREVYKVAQVLETIYPDQMNHPDAELPDLLFDQIRQDLHYYASNKEPANEAPPYLAPRDEYSSGAGIRSPYQPARDAGHRARELLGDLVDNIDPGWTYARNIGRECLSRDSINFLEFVRSNGKFSSLATRRHQLWNEFLSEYLNFKRARLLLVTLDDCDLSPAHANQVMNDLRLYFRHPRIVVLMALGVKETKHAMRSARLAAFRPAIDSLSRSAGGTAMPGSGGPAGERELRRQRILDVLEEDLEFEWAELDQRIAKLLPPPNRFSIQANCEDDVDVVLFGQSVSDKVIRDRAAELTIQESVSLWLWRTRYRDALASLTMRDLSQIRMAMLDGRDARNGDSPKDATEVRPLLGAGNFAEHVWQCASMETFRTRTASTSAAAFAGRTFKLTDAGGEIAIEDDLSGLPLSAPARFVIDAKRIDLDAGARTTPRFRCAGRELQDPYMSLDDVGEFAIGDKVLDWLAARLSAPWTAFERLEPADRASPGPRSLGTSILPTNCLTLADAVALYPRAVNASEQILRIVRGQVPQNSLRTVNEQTLHTLIIPREAAEHEAITDIGTMVREIVDETLSRLRDGTARPLNAVASSPSDSSIRAAIDRLVTLLTYGEVLRAVVAQRFWADGISDRVSGRLAIDSPDHQTIRVVDRDQFAVAVSKLTLVTDANPVFHGALLRMAFAVAVAASATLPLAGSEPPVPSNDIDRLIGNLRSPDVHRELTAVTGMLKRMAAPAAPLDPRDRVLLAIGVFDGCADLYSSRERSELLREVQRCVREPLGSGLTGGPVPDPSSREPVDLAALARTVRLKAQELAKQPLRSEEVLPEFPQSLALTHAQARAAVRLFGAGPEAATATSAPVR